MLHPSQPLRSSPRGDYIPLISTQSLRFTGLEGLWYARHLRLFYVYIAHTRICTYIYIYTHAQQGTYIHSRVRQNPHYGRRLCWQGRLSPLAGTGGGKVVKTTASSRISPLQAKGGSEPRCSRVGNRERDTVRAVFTPPTGQAMP